MIDSEPQDSPAIETRKAPLRPRRRLRTGQEVRDRRLRVYRYALAGGILVLLVNALVGESGLLAGIHARREQDAIAAQVLRVHTENVQLADQARRLTDDPAALEDAA